MKDLLEHMLQLQSQLNQQINPDWLQAGQAWYRAIWIETAELIDHYGWKWWQHQPQDWEQIRLELIDIWHFALSAELAAQQGHIQAAVEHMIQAWPSSSHASTDFIELAETLALTALQKHQLDLPAFMQLMQQAGMSFDSLYRLYIGKNVLNRFRQDHGYRQGHYQKQWQGREDNQHLAEICQQIELSGAELEQAIYQALQQRYPD